VNVYVETNFVLELVFEQEQQGSCQQILALAEENERFFSQNAEEIRGIRAGATWLRSTTCATGYFLRVVIQRKGFSASSTRISAERPAW
jgi:hypothetical protein